MSGEMRDGRYVVSASGELDLAGAPAFAAALDRAASHDCPMVVDLRGVTFMDSTGINALVAHAVGGGSAPPQVLTSPEIARLFEISGVAALLHGS